jgi:AAA domain
VQGDEREVIIFSCAVGADVTGRITAQISSLNTEGGHRRLNVAITRARREMVVFSSMTPSKSISADRTRAGSSTSSTSSNSPRTGPAPSPRLSPQPAATRNLLSKKRSKARWKPGTGSFIRRLASPTFGSISESSIPTSLVSISPGSKPTARNFTGRQPRATATSCGKPLENLGWRILRIWSTEWWLDSTAALEKVHQRLLMILEEDRASEWQHEVEPKPEPDDAIDQAPDIRELLGAEVPPASDGGTHVEELHAAECAIAEPVADRYEGERFYADLAGR